MKASQIANAYLLELVADAMPQHPDLRTLMPDLLNRGQAQGARALLMGCLKPLGYEPALMGREAAKVARRAMRAPDPLSAVREEAASNPLALTDGEAALRSEGWGVAAARAYAATPEGARVAHGIAHGA